MINIRTIETKDNQVIKKIIQDNLEYYHLDKPGTAYYDPQLDDLEKFYSKINRSEYWVLTKDNRVIGGVGIAPFGKYVDVAELQKYYIHERYQGMGYGNDLFQQAKEYAIQQGYKKLYLETHDSLIQANRVYEHYGFEKLKNPLDGSEHSAMNIWYLYDLTK